MDLGIRGKAALVTAASKGLGRAVAQALAAEGVSVAIAARGEAALRTTAEAIARETGVGVLAIPADVSSVDDLARLVQDVERQLGEIDILVNNAGGPRPGRFSDVSDEDWAAALELTLMSAVRLSRMVLPAMRRRRWGRIINMTSISVKQPIPNLILSNAARSAVVAMARTLADEVGPEGITVNNVCPGYTATDRVRELNEATARAEGITPEQVGQRTVSAIPVGRMGDPAELAALVTFLASQQAAFITGATIQVDGGQFRGLM